MNERLIDLLSDESTSAEVLRAYVSEHPDATRFVAAWTGMESHLRDAAPDRRLLVLHALSNAGRGSVLTEAEHSELAAYRPALETAFRGLPALNDVVAAVQADADAFDEAWNEAFPVAAVPARIRSASRPPLRLAKVPRWSGRVAVAASLVGVAVLSILLLRPGSDRFETAPGETISVLLDDGSRVRLLGASTLLVDGREVELDGDAYFDVVPDAVRFSVLTETASTTVLGTRFAVSTDPGRTEVVLVSGRVAVSPRGRSDQFVLLEPGERTVVTHDGKPTEPRAVHLVDALDWTGLLLFRATTLREVAARLTERYGTVVTVDSALSAETVTGSFALEQSLDEVLGIIARAVDATVQHAETGRHLVPN